MIAKLTLSAASMGRSSRSALELFCAQSEVLVDMLSTNGGAGAFVNVAKDCLRMDE